MKILILFLIILFISAATYFVLINLKKKEDKITKKINIKQLDNQNIDINIKGDNKITRIKKKCSSEKLSSNSRFRKIKRSYIWLRK